MCKLLGERNTVNDLFYYDAALHKQLMKLRQLSAEAIEDLDLTFTVTDTVFGKSRTVELIPNGIVFSKSFLSSNSHNAFLIKKGAKTDVTKDNLHRFIAYIAYFRLNLQIKTASEAFQEGLLSVIPTELLRVNSSFQII